MNRKVIRIVLFCLLSIILFFVKNEYQYHHELSKIKNNGVLLVGTTGDYKPMSFYDKKTKTYYGFDIALAENLASSLDLKVKFVHTTWPTLMKDTLTKKFDVAISGITITEERKKLALMSKNYLVNGKTLLCRVEDVNKYKSLDSINLPNVKVMENPGGLNEEFARKNFPKATIIIHEVNEEIPNLIASGKADVMITEIAEALFYSNQDKRLAAPLVNSPFTKGETGILIPKNNKTMLKYVNKFLANERKNGNLTKLSNIYIYKKNYVPQ